MSNSTETIPTPGIADVLNLRQWMVTGRFLAPPIRDHRPPDPERDARIARMWPPAPLHHNVHTSAKQALAVFTQTWATRPGHMAARIPPGTQVSISEWARRAGHPNPDLRADQLTWLRASDLEAAARASTSRTETDRVANLCRACQVAPMVGAGDTCQDCRDVAEFITRETAAKVKLPDGRTRRQAVADWLNQAS